MSTARKELVWSIKKNLYTLSCIEAYQLARGIATDGQGADDLESTNEEGCDTVVIRNGITQEHETPTTMPAGIVDHTTISHANSDTSTTKHCSALPMAVATVHTTQQHTDLSRDTTTQSVDQLQVMHEELTLQR